jgi:CPA2 family monovalent cation:H+ antiporter-2
MLAGTVLSIVAVPWLYKASMPLAQWLEATMPMSPLATIPDNSSESTTLRGHAVICGYGRVGRVVGAALQRRDFEYVVIDSDPSVVAQLRKDGQVALLGNAAHHVLLERAAVERARVLVVAIPDPIATRQILAYATAFRRLDIVVRTHSESEREFFSQRGASEAVLGELELALEMSRHTLHRFGLTTVETQAIINSLRGRGIGPSEV